MLEYYENRQSEYESIYSKPERQEDLAWLSDQLQKFTTDSNVFELACGTGYWTRRMVAYASSVHATDLSPQLVTAALASCIGGKSSGSTIDAFNLPENLESAYDCLVAGFLFSHILIEQRQSFLKGIVKAIGAGARLVLFDNRFVEGSSTPLSRYEFGNSYQQRQLENSSTFEVLKNFPSAPDLEEQLDAVCDQVVVSQSQYFWICSGTLK